MDDTKLVGKKQNLGPMWKVLMKDVDLGVASRMSAGAIEKLLCSAKFEANIPSWSYDREGHAK